MARGAAAAAGGLLAPGRAPLTIGLVLVVTMAAFEALAVATVLPQAEKDLGGLGLYGLIFVAYMTASLAGIVVAGREADRRGLALPMAAGLVLFATGLTIGGLAPAMAILIAARGVQGLGAGGIITCAYAAISRVYDDSQRPRMFAVLSSAWVVPGLVGPSLAGAVADHLTWRLVFLGILPLVAIGALATVPALARLPAIAQTAEGGPLRLLREVPALAPAIVVFALLTMSFFGAEAYLPLMLSDVRGQSSTISGLALSAGTISWTSGSWLQERRAEAWDRQMMVRGGLVLVAAGTVLQVVVAQGGPIWLAPVVWVLAGGGIGMAYPTMSVIILGAAPPERAGAASAAINTGSVLGQVTGTGLGAAVVGIGAAGAWETDTSVTVIFAAMACAAAVAIASSRRLYRASHTIAA